MNLDDMIPPEEKKVCPTDESEDEYEDDDTAEDLYNAMGLLQDNLTFLEAILKDDIARRFLKVSDRISLMQHAGEVMTFLDQFDPETESETE